MSGRLGDAGPCPAAPEFFALVFQGGKKTTRFPSPPRQTSRAARVGLRRFPILRASKSQVGILGAL